MSATRTAWVVAVLVALCLPHTALGADRCGKLSAVERWQGEFTLTASDDARYAPGGVDSGMYHKYRWNASGSIDLLPEYDGKDRLAASWSGQKQGFTATMNDVDGQRGGDPPVDLSVIMEARNLAEDESSARLNLNCERGEYRLAVYAARFLVKRHIELPASMKELCKAGAGKGDNALPAAMLCALIQSEHEKFEREPMNFTVRGTTDDVHGNAATFDPQNMTLTGKRRIKTGETMMNGKELEADFSWTLRPSKPTPYEAVIVTGKTFSLWIPEANKDNPAVAGSAVSVEVQLRRKDKPKEPAEEKGHFEFELLDVSHAPGWCTNFPVHGDTEADLRIEKSMNSGMDVPEPHRASTKVDATSATLWMSSFDMGAHARLRVTVTTASGQRLVAHLEDKPNISELRVPLDDDDNQVADAWQKANNVEQGRGVTWDEDPPMHKRLGDGYTLFEEYRGFMSEAGYVRTSPNAKDLFVYDTTGMVKKYYERPNPAKLVIHHIDPTMMRFTANSSNPEDRWVNFNSRPEDWYARQYAMYLLHGTRDGDSLACARLVGADCVRDPVLSDNALKNTWGIEMDLAKAAVAVAGLQEPTRSSYLEMAVENAVIHEMMHALEVPHHWDSQGQETKESVATGVASCVMRYYTPEEEHLIVPVQRQVDLCHKGQTWKRTVEKIGRKGRKITTTVTMPAHDCWGKVDVKSDP